MWLQFAQKLCLQLQHVLKRSLSTYCILFSDWLLLCFLSQFQIGHLYITAAGCHPFFNLAHHGANWRTLHVGHHGSSTHGCYE
jgi:hypothetical protein